MGGVATPVVQADIESVTYYGALKAALAGVHLEVQPGEFVVITGPAASGKSTLCYCLTGVIPHAVTAELVGEIRVGGRLLAELRLPEVAARLGYVMQAPENQLFSLSVGEDVSFGPENLCLASSEVRRRVQAALQFTGMIDSIDRPSDQLSGGQAQRVVLSAVLALEPPVLVLDQPAAELDPEGRWQVYQNLHRLNQAGKTILLVEDRLSDVAAFATRIILMRAGAVIRDEATRTFFSHEDLDRWGVRVPDTVQLHHYLRERGYNSRPVPLSVAELADQVALRAPVATAAVSPPLPLRPPSRPGQEAVIEVTDLSYTYPGGVQALDRVSLRCQSGEFLAIIGENGAGKTSLAKHLIGLLKPTGGRVCVAGRDVARLSVAEASRSLGYLFQDPDYQIFKGSVFDEVAFGLRVRKTPSAAMESAVMAVLARLKLDHLRREHPYTLSRGQRQRLALAATLVLHPPILLVDEPSTGLDHEEARDVLQLLEEFRAEGGTVLIITHDLELVFAYARRVVVMQRGRILLDLPASDVQAHFDQVSAAGVRLPQFMHMVSVLKLPAEINSVAAVGDAVLAAARR